MVLWHVLTKKLQNGPLGHRLTPVRLSRWVRCSGWASHLVHLEIILRISLSTILLSWALPTLVLLSLIIITKLLIWIVSCCLRVSLMILLVILLLILWWSSIPTWLALKLALILVLLLVVLIIVIGVIILSVIVVSVVIVHGCLWY